MRYSHPLADEVDDIYDPGKSNTKSNRKRLMEDSTPVWFITGASRGLGRALVTYALESGARVVATARSRAALQQLVEDFDDKYDNERILTVVLDVRDYTAAEHAVRRTIHEFGKVDIIVNNAGYAEVASVEDTKIESIQQQINTNLLGVVNVSKAFINILRSQKSGHIFQISSIGSRAASPGLGAYQAAKYGVAGFSGVLAAELKPFGIKVTCLEPGAMPTEWAAGQVWGRQGYEETVGKHKERFEAALASGKATKLENFGKIIETLWKEADTPIRMLVGADAVEYGKVLGEKLRESDEKWKELGRSASD